MPPKETFTTTSDYNSKAPRWLLYLGIFFFITGIVVQIAFPGLLNTNHTDHLIDIFLDNFPKVFVYVSTILIAPIIEELGFRAWQLKNKLIKGLAILISFGYAVHAFGITFGLGIAIAMAILIFHKPNRRRVLGVLFTSLLFALIHWGNYSDIGTQIITMVMIFGLGLVMSYLTWRFSLIWAILFHCIYNVLAMQTMFIKYEAKNIHTATYEMSIQQISYIETIRFSYEENSVIAQAQLNTIVDNWIENYYTDSTYFYINQDKTPKIELNITMKPKADKQQVLDTLISTFGYQFDTVIMLKYYLSIPEGRDTPTVTLLEDKIYSYERLDYIVNTLRSNNNIPVFYDKLNANRIVKINSLSLYNISGDDLIKALAQGNIYVVKDSSATIKGINLIPKRKIK